MEARRKRLRLPDYEALMSKTTDSEKINELLDEAASCPKRLLSDADYEKLYWYAQDLLKGEDA